MKREFLQNLKVGDNPLPKEVIDAIMDENGKDIEAAKKPFADYEALKEKLKLAEDGLKAFDGVDVESLKGEITKLQGQLTAKDTEWQGKFDEMTFDSLIKDAIAQAKGKNAKAITALLDMDKLKSSKNRDTDIKAALDALRTESGYLFEDNGGAAYFDRSGGNQGGGGSGTDMSRMSMADYIAARHKK